MTAPLRGYPIGLTFFLLMCSVLARADEICSNLYENSCSSELIYDGTGLVAIQNINQSNENVAAKTLEFFNRNKNNFRQSARLHLNLNCINKSPRTKNTQPPDTAPEICDQEILQKLNALTQSRNINGTSGRYSSEDLRFMEESGFLTLMNDISFEGRVLVDIAEQEKKAEKLFPQIKEALIGKIKASDIPFEKKRILIDRLIRLENRGTDCGQYFFGINKSYLPKAFYSPDNNSFLLCRNLLNQVNSEFAITTIIAHEISHSIDPCVLGNIYPEEFSAKNIQNLKATDSIIYPNLTSCLRSRDSVRAKNIKIENKSYYETCSDYDQLHESFSDWFASEVLVDIINKNHPELTQEQWQNGFRNSFRAKCDQQHLTEQLGFDPHPPLEDRYNAILLANQAVREKMGCTKPYNKVQCSIDRYVTLENRNSPTGQIRSSSPSNSNSKAGTTK